MNIIQAHKFYWWRDGASNYALYLSELLEKDGNRVIPFAMRHKNNLSSKYDKFFVSELELQDPGKVGLRKKISSVFRMMYSVEARKRMKELLREEKIDMLHLHNIYHHISPSILPVAKKKGIPVVMTLHDYKLICPNYTMFHHGKIHEEDCKGWYLNCVKNKCMKDSRLQSLIVAKEMFFHHKVMKYYEKYVDKFIAPSQFIMKKCIEFGWPKEKFVHIPHPIDMSKFSVQNQNKGYVAYVGRLSEEKGIKVLLSAAERTKDVQYKIVGEGPLLEELKVEVSKKGLSNIEFTGFKSGKELEEIIKNARLLVLPSLWYENYPISVLEAKSMGKVMVGSNIGGLREMLPKDMLVKPGDVEELAGAIEKWHSTSEGEREKRGLELRKEVEKVNDPVKHVQEIEKLYKSLQ